MLIVVFSMQCGFCMLEVGTVRVKNTKNILVKNILDACIGAIFYWAFGYAFRYVPISCFKILLLYRYTDVFSLLTNLHFFIFFCCAHIMIPFYIIQLWIRL